MMEDQDLIKTLLEKYKAGTITDAEKAVLDQWYLHVAADSGQELSDEDRLQTFDNVLHHLQEVIAERRTRRLWPRISAAAAIILITGAGLFYYNSRTVTNQQANLVKQDVKPGGNKAYLTLANGSKILLTGAKIGQLAKQTGITITKTADGQVVYSVEHTIHNNAANTEYNTIETPKGGQYEVKLPDGTEVWLNAASSLKYPASFAALKDRRVELTGEAYFEVAKDKAHPFVVKTNNEDVEVLGTHFNINNYADEASTKTTLLEGSVQVSTKTGDRVKIKPGQQAILNPSGNIAIEEVNVNKAIAWKNGKFVFESENISSIMRKLARWYDVEIIYKDEFPDRTFTGSISRYDNISKILNKIMLTQAIHFKIEGRRVTIMR